MSDATATTGGEATTEGVIVRQQPPRTQKVGRVVSDKMDKTVVVAVDYVKRHPLYHKRITRTSKFMAHDERNNCRPGDVVRIEETRPLSKRKRWIVREVIERAVQV
ncbi:MAG TPA: 30S ribosomal protein S17 [Thermomicrobiales bacterium]|nr:30S ribosomal protein S17 [Thermomicrobiales bacterium]